MICVLPLVIERDESRVGQQAYHRFYGEERPQSQDLVVR